MAGPGVAANNELVTMAMTDVAPLVARALGIAWRLPGIEDQP